MRADITNIRRLEHVVAGEFLQVRDGLADAGVP